MWTRLQAFSRLKGTARSLWKGWSDSEPCKVSPDFLLEGVTPKCERAATAL